MKVIPGSRGCATDARYIATRHGGYDDGPRMTGRSIPRVDTATRVACANENAPQRTDVPLTMRSTNPGVRAADQIQYSCPWTSVAERATVPVEDVSSAGSRSATDPSRLHEP